MITEKIVVGKDTAYPLNGLLTLPESVDTPVPAAVLVHGSGSSNMDEHIGKLYPFRDLAEGLAKYGIAVIRYDKRSFSHGLKMVKDKPVTVFKETIEDAILAAGLLRNDPRIDPERVFIIGHSMGAMLAPRIDAEGGNFKGLVMMAGTPYKLEEVLIRQFGQMKESMSGLTGKIVAGQAEKTAKMFDGLYDLSDEEALKKKAGGGTTLYYFKEMGEHPSSDYLLNTDKPVFIMQGEKDFQVLADVDFKGYQDMLEGKENVTFKLYPGLSHLFVTAQYDDITKMKKEYNVEKHIPEDVIRDIAEFINR